MGDEQLHSLPLRGNVPRPPAMVGQTLLDIAQSNKKQAAARALP